MQRALPGTVEVTVHGRSTVHSSGTRSRASGTTSGVRRDVGGTLRTAVVGVLGVVQRHLVHVKLIGHDGVVSERL